MPGELDLIRKYEPVLRFGRGRDGKDEGFFPMAASHYVHACGLRRKAHGWVCPPGGTLLRHLSTVDTSKECYLSYAAGDLPEDGIVLKMMDLGLELARPELPATPAAGVADAVEPGVVIGERVSRILVGPDEAEAVVSLLETHGAVIRRPAMAADVSLGAADAEGAVQPMEWLEIQGLAELPAAVHERALAKYAPYRDWHEYPPVYYYRVSRDGPFTVLHYWFLYAYNDWAAHGGKNDHEGDWEVVFVFLDAREEPQHVAYSRHVKVPLLFEPLTAPWSGVERAEGTHPVVYVGCGSHASYLKAGVHLILAYEDHALGDGLSIGPGSDHTWGRPQRLDRKRWNARFRGQWGSLVKRWSLAVMPGTVGPTGPAQKGEKWANPAAWAGLT